MGVLKRALWYFAVLLGIVVFGGALAVLLVPSLRAALPVEALVDVAGSDYLLVAVFGGLALVALLVMLVARAVGSVEQERPPEPEYVERVPLLGAEFDDLVENGVGVRAMLSGDEADRIRERLREQATRTLMRKRNLSRERADDLVERGAWTDRRVPSAFLAGGSIPTKARVKAAIRGQTWLQFAASETADEIVRLADERHDRSVRTGAGDRPTDASASSSTATTPPGGRPAATDGGDER
ncbi:DUF7269 family protein [Halomarina litorea]|uniref:DUF7269 family protein n=1 Tax=Halomarina litorea TaxID=2961595 RepID=UPI0020C412E8|nr:hypothetical protein [Halomarina sp. BCD28]